MLYLSTLVFDFLSRRPGLYPRPVHVCFVTVKVVMGYVIYHTPTNALLYYNSLKSFYILHLLMHCYTGSSKKMDGI